MTAYLKTLCLSSLFTSTALVASGGVEGLMPGDHFAKERHALQSYTPYEWFDQENITTTPIQKKTIDDNEESSVDDLSDENPYTPSYTPSRTWRGGSSSRGGSNSRGLTRDDHAKIKEHQTINTHDTTDSKRGGSSGKRGGGSNRRGGSS
ncbi:MAG: hypothetical protein K2X98_03020 [Alphaproteobacteria bacterium]|nr:hypothetical protein [Alphaproteobacteria bacterium]